MLEWLHWQDCQIERGARAMNLIYYPSLLAASNLRSEKIKKAGQRKKRKHTVNCIMIPPLIHSFFNQPPFGLFISAF